MSGKVGAAESAKSEALVPLIDALERIRSAVPVLVMVSVSGSLEVPFN